MADTYGVYKETFEEGQRSELVEGGVTERDLQNIINDLFQHQAYLVAEFNSFASPTSQAVQKQLTSLLNISWTGWVGRYFHELSLSEENEVPAWAIDEYENQSKEEWSFSGPGFLLVDEQSHIIVLEEGVDVKEGGINLNYTNSGQEEFDLKDSPPYTYWFDIIEPNNEEQVFAYYNWNLSESGKMKLANAKIPYKFAAITKTKNNAVTAYYFAGDYVDLARVPRFYKIKGYTKVQQFISNFTEENSFYWKNYVPMMKKIIEKSIHDKNVGKNRQ